MIKVNIFDKEYEFPTSWDDITMKEYCKLFHNLPQGTLEADENDKFADVIEKEAVIISRLLKEKDDFALNIPIDVFVYLQDNCKFLYEIEDFMNSKIFYLKIDGRRYWIPEPKDMSLRQYIDSDMIMKEESENQFIELLACLLLPYDKEGKYEYDGKYEDLIPKIENMRASDGLPFVYTFFKKKELSKKLMETSSKVEEVADQLLHSIQGS